jgi:arylsulfatase A-like enzyme
VVFEQARSTGPSTRFSVPPLLVGKYMTEIRRSWGFWPRIHRSEVLITEHLKKAGYTNAVVHSIDYFRKRFGMKKGFHHYDDSCIQVVDEKKRRRLGWMHCKWWVPTSRYVTRRVRRLVEQQKLYNSQPFFLWTYYSDPHGPYIRHRHYPPHGGFYEHRYDGEISYTDHHISHMLTSLEKRGMLKDTVIIISSDHGEGLNRKKDHGSLLHSANLFDELLHVPLIIAGPGIKPRRVKTVVSTLDIPSTMMDLAGLKKSPAHRGMSLVPYLKGQSPPHPPVFFEKHRRQDTPLKGMLDWPHKVIGNMKWKTVRVFNLETDPNERKPLTNKTMDATKRKALIKRFWHWVNVERKAYNDKLRH